jgi:ribosomal protein S18 acetylase RimI-like enzyme
LEKKITIRQLSPEDAAIFQRLRLQGLRESPAAFAASYEEEEKISVDEIARRLAASPDNWVLGAFADGELAGVVGFYREQGLRLRHKGKIWGMYVTPGHRGRRIGEDLMRECVAKIDAMTEVRSARLSVNPTQTAAIKLYEKFGFTKYGEEPDALLVDGAYHSFVNMVRIRGGNRGEWSRRSQSVEARRVI